MAYQKRSVGGTQMPLFTPASYWTPPALSDLPDWSKAKRVAVDVETHDPNLKKMGIGVRHGGRMIGISFKIEDGPQAYLPFGHAEDNMDKAAVIRYMAHQAKNFEGDIVGAHLPYDLDYLAEDGVVFRQAKSFRDVQVADPLICELHDRYSLQHICERWGIPGKDEALLREAAAAYCIDPKSEMYKLPARFVGAYAEGDCDRPLKVLRKQELEIEKQDLWNIYDLESEVLPVLVKMRRRGVRVNQDKLAKVEDWSLTEEGEQLAEVKRATGVTIGVGDVWKADALVPALEQIGVDVPRLDKGYSITAEFLDQVDHPVADALKRARQVNKLRTTFVQSVRRYMVNGRIHSTFNQLRKEKDNGDLGGAAYGRLSSEDLNFQQQPARADFAGMWRSIYEPEEGMLWSSKDYSQQEPRMAIDYAEQLKLEKATRAGDQYREDPTTDNHQMVADLAGIPRKPAKAIFLGICYGMGGAKLCRELGLDTRWGVFGNYGTPAQYFEDYEDAARARANVDNGKLFEVAGEEGQELLNKVDAELPFLKKLAKKTQKVADKRGYIKTILGRRCRFPLRADGAYDWTHKALNRLIQGSAADQTKKALVEVDKAGFFLQLQVHDELGGSAKDVAEAKAAADIMTHCIDLRVPAKVDVEIGPSWGEAIGVEQYEQA